MLYLTMKLKLRTIEKLKLFGQMVAGLYVIFIMGLFIMQKLSLENSGIAFIAAFAIITLISLVFGDHR